MAASVSAAEAALQYMLLCSHSLCHAPRTSASLADLYFTCPRHTLQHLGAYHNNTPCKENDATADLIVHFHEGDFDSDLPVHSDVHLLKDVVQCPRGDASLAELLGLSRHGVGFAGTSLQQRDTTLNIVHRQAVLRG